MVIVVLSIPKVPVKMSPDFTCYLYIFYPALLVRITENGDMPLGDSQSKK